MWDLFNSTFNLFVAKTRGTTSSADAKKKKIANRLAKFQKGHTDLMVSRGHVLKLLNMERHSSQPSFCENPCLIPFQFGALVLLDPTWESTNLIWSTPRSKEIPALLRIVLERGQQDMREKLSPENLRNPELRKAREKDMRRKLLLDLIDILAGPQLSSWVDQSLVLLDKAGQEYDEDDIIQTDDDMSYYISIGEGQPVSLTFLFLRSIQPC